MSQVSVVVPVYQNASSLPDLLSEFRKLADRNTDDQFEFVFVDDGSEDDSLAVLETFAKSDPRIRVVKLSRNFGSNAATLAGLSQARGAAVAVISADLQDPPQLIHDMLKHWRQGCKVVLAARQGRDETGFSLLMARIFYWLFRRFAIPSMPKHGFDFFVIDRQVTQLVNGIQENNAYLMGLIMWLGFRPKFIHYQRRRREAHYGTSAWTLSKRLRHFVNCFVAFSYAPVRAASIVGIGLSLLGFVYALIIIISRLTLGIEIQGWASIMVALLIVSGVQMVMTGVLGEYVWRNLSETRRRPRFIIDEVIEPAPIGFSAPEPAKKGE